MRARLLLWPAAVALLVLCARVLEGSAGGPGFVTVVLVSLGLAATVSIFVVWLASLGVRERARLRPERVAPRLRLRRLALRAVALYLASSIVFAMFESYLHWRAGLGFHGLSCLVGPVHRNAIPLLAALALLAAALAEAGGHVLAWMRAAIRELRCPRLGPVLLPLRFAAPVTPAARMLPARPRPRGPPVPA